MKYPRHSRACAPRLASIVFVASMACGGGGEPDPILEDELAREAAAESGGERELTPAEENQHRLRAVETRIYEACYDGLDHLPPEARRRRRLRHAHVLSRRELAEGEQAAGIEFSAGRELDAVRPGGTTNVDPTSLPSPYRERELAIIVLEDRFDAFRAEHPDAGAMSTEDITELEDIGDELHDACRARD